MGIVSRRRETHTLLFILELLGLRCFTLVHALALFALDRFPLAFPYCRHARSIHSKRKRPALASAERKSLWRVEYTPAKLSVKLKKQASLNLNFFLGM